MSRFSMRHVLKKSDLRLFRKKDLLWLLFFFLLLTAYFLQQSWGRWNAWGAWRGSASKTVAEIWQGTQLIDRFELQESAKRWSYAELPNVIFETDPKGRIRFSENDCPNQICVQASWQDQPGAIIACLPKGIVLKLLPPPHSSKALFPLDPNSDSPLDAQVD